MTLFAMFFILPIEGNNFFKGIVTDKSLSFNNNAIYEVLKSPLYSTDSF